MRTLLSRPIQIDPNFHVALGFVVIFGVAEIFFATSHYVGLARANRTSTKAIATAVTRLPQVSPAPASQPAPVAAQRSTPPAPAITSPAPSFVDQLVREGKELKKRGDTTNALDRFRKALDSEPDNTSVIEEMAQTYESMQLFDQANEFWRRIKQISPSDSEIYALADRRLKVGVPVAAPSEPASANPDNDAAQRKDIGGNPDGPIMGISEVKIKETQDPEAETNLALEIGIKKQSSAAIDHDKVKIMVFLYDIVNDKDIKLTDAEVSNEWLTPKHDWSGADPEMLLVHYVRPKTGGALSESSLSEAAAKVRPGQKGRSSKSPPEAGQRKYLGYIVRVYYGDDLQAVQAEPARLLQQFPTLESPAGR